MSTKILFLTRYDRCGASSRYRIYQYLPFLEQAGFEGVVHPLFVGTYLQRIYSAQPRYRQLMSQVPVIARTLFGRWQLLGREIQNYDLVYLQYDALPYLPLVLERRVFAPGVRVVVDYDDAVHISYQQHSNFLVRRILGAKIPNIVKQSHQVIVGNRHLAEWAANFNRNVRIIPTSVDLERYPLDPTTRSMNTRPVIGWIGTPITAKYLQLLKKPLQVLRTRHDFVLKVIGAPNLEMDGITMIQVPWSEASEVEELHTCDVGVMPLPDDVWARGKSALKLIQYLATGIAAVASPVGANCDVLQDGENGLLAGTETEWVEKIALLIENPTYREQLAQAGYRTVQSRYSLQANAPKWIDILRQVVSNEP
ncbi:MAG: glycosyltransferase family 4 protein [Chloroflexi bacterium]|nr:glycosyltransferase family 4 protein [Chloroflexota bacterium]MBU1750218.1 glycosyltransferase family 4 protein [Chloroflexota bacterium]